MANNGPLRTVELETSCVAAIPIVTVRAAQKQLFVGTGFGQTLVRQQILFFCAVLAVGSPKLQI
jgi:hypothetical protein